MKPTLWVFWFGQFMEFFTPYLLPHFDIFVYDRTGKNDTISQLWATRANLQEAASCDFVLLGYPAGSIELLLQDISPYIQKEAVVFDICSVKTISVQYMKKYLPLDCHIIATHPIFWPQSGKDGIKGLKMTLSNIRCDTQVFEEFKNLFWKKLELSIFEMTPEEHDKDMAYIQGITHFIGRALKDISIPSSALATESYAHLRQAKEMVGNDSDALFLSIQSDNPFVENVRGELLEEFQKLESWIISQK